MTANPDLYLLCTTGSSVLSLPALSNGPFSPHLCRYSCVQRSARDVFLEMIDNIPAWQRSPCEPQSINPRFLKYKSAVSFQHSNRSLCSLPSSADSHAGSQE